MSKPDRVFATAGDWALASDGHQWMLMRGQLNGQWRALSFVSSTKDILARCCREKGVDAPTALKLLAGLPDTFDEWRALQAPTKGQRGPPKRHEPPPLAIFRSPELRWLYDGSRKTGLSVRPDLKWPGMWRIHYPDGVVSDMVNFSRATDAGRAWLVKQPNRNAENFRWKEEAALSVGGRTHRVSGSEA